LQWCDAFEPSGSLEFAGVSKWEVALFIGYSRGALTLTRPGVGGGLQQADPGDGSTS
jgi:hypothetical protein